MSWLPLYHDMGLVGCLAIPMTTGATLVQAAPQDFMARPGNWMQWISDFRGTATAGPNFSWVLATRALKRMHDLDLSTLTLALSGAEPVDPDAVEAFVAAAAPFGFPAGGVFPAFGMAEVAIGGSFPQRGRGLVCDTVDRIVLERDRVAKPIEVADPDDFALTARRLPLLGTPVPGLEMRIVDPESLDERPERHVGELLIRGTSVTPGYYKRPDATAELFDDGWLRTGDLAYMIDGELVLCGRIKDVIIVGGRNVFPEDIERAVGLIDGVRAGNVIAFGMDGYKGKESVVVVAETKADARRPRRPAPRHPPPHAGGVRPAAARRDARPAVDAAEDVLGQAAAGEVPRAVPRGAARARLTQMPMSTVAVFASDRHRLHDPEHEIESSALQAPFEHPGRADGDPRRPRRRRALRHRPSRRRRARRRSRPSTIPASCASSPSAWDEYQREIGPTHDVVPDVFAMPGLRAGMGPPAEPSPVGARLGWWCFETTTPLTAGTYEAARSAVDCARRRDRRRARRRAARLRAVPAARPPRHDVAVRRLLLLQQRGDRRGPRRTVVARARRRARRRLPPRQRHPADLLRARRRGVRVAARRPRRGPTRTSPATPTRRAPGGGAGRRRTSRCRPPPTTTPTSPRSTGRSPRSTRSPPSSSSSRSVSTRTPATRCATWP